MVMLYFELCEHIWGGSPVTEQIPSGVESQDIAVDVDQDVGTSDTTVSVHGSSSSSDTASVPGSLNSSLDDDTVATKEVDAATEEDSRATVKQRRELLGVQLNNYRKDKLKRKLPVDTQLLTCAKEDVSLKKNQMDKMDTLHNEHMQKLSSNMEKLTNSISSGFSLLQGLLYPPPVQPMYQPTGYPFNQSQQGGIPFGPDYNHDCSSQGSAMRNPYTDSGHLENYHGSDQ